MSGQLEKISSIYLYLLRTFCTLLLFNRKGQKCRKTYNGGRYKKFNEFVGGCHPTTHPVLALYSLLLFFCWQEKSVILLPWNLTTSNSKDR